MVEPDPDIAADMMLAAEGFRASGAAALRGRELRAAGERVAAQRGVLDGSSVRRASVPAPTACTPRPLRAPSASWARRRAARPWEPSADLGREEPGSLACRRRLRLGGALGRRGGREDVMLGMRLSRGVAAADVERAGLDDACSRAARRGAGGPRRARGARRRWRTTTQGWLLGNEVFGRVWNAEDEGC